VEEKGEERRGEERKGSDVPEIVVEYRGEVKVIWRGEGATRYMRERLC